MLKWNRFYREAEAGGAAGGDPAGGGAPAGGAPGGGAAPAWHEKLGDQGLTDFVTTKGFNKGTLDEVTPQIVRSYHNLEKLFGADKAGRTVEVPDFDKADDIAKGQFFDRIGRPKDFKDYDLALPKEGVDAGFEKWARESFHKEGLTAKQANAIGKAWNDFTVARAAEAETALKQVNEGNVNSLKKEWGAAYDDKSAKVDAVAKNLGITDDALLALRSAMGGASAMKMLATVADKLGEDAFVSGGEGGGGNMTPAEAKAELQRLQGDKEWMAKWLDKSHPGHKEAVARKTFLSGMIAAPQAAA